MSLEERVLTLFAEGDPVPDPDDLEPVEVEAAAYLATLEQRSGEVRQLDEKIETSPKTEQPKRWLRPVAATITAILVLGLGWGLVSNQQEMATSTTVTQTILPEPTTAPTTVSTTEDAWSSIRTYIGSSPRAGTYRTQVFEPAFSFDALSGWRPIPPEQPYAFGMTPNTQWDDAIGIGPNAGLYVLDMDVGSVQQTVDALSVYLDLAGEPLTADVGDAEGLSFDATTTVLRQACCATGDDVGAGGDPTGAGLVYLEGDKTYRFYIVDVGGTTVTIAFEALSDDFDAFQERAERILDSIVWKDLG